jgi:hypothetical protein
VFCGTGAEGGSCAQAAMVTITNKNAAVVSRIVEAMRANGIYSSPFKNNATRETALNLRQLDFSEQ